MEILLGYGIVGAKSSRVIVEYYLLCVMRPVIMTEVIYQLTKLPLILYIEGIDDFEPHAIYLTGHQPIYISVEVKCNGYRSIEIQITIEQASIVLLIRNGKQANILERSVVVTDVGMQILSEVRIEAISEPLYPLG